MEVIAAEHVDDLHAALELAATLGLELPLAGHAHNATPEVWGADNESGLGGRRSWLRVDRSVVDQSVEFDDCEQPPDVRFRIADARRRRGETRDPLDPNE